MIQLRWYHWYITDDNGFKHEHVKLQSRQYLDTTVRAGYTEATPMVKNMQWSDWTDVTHAWEDME